MGDDIPNFKAAARNKHRNSTHNKDKPAKYRQQKSADTPSSDNKTKKPSIDLKTTVLDISAPELEEFSRRELSSNWSKYEDDIVLEENDQLSAHDFAELLQMPAGGHFQFNSEKKWGSSKDDDDTVTKKFSKYFHLDTSILNCGLLTIPFYERQQYDKGMFRAEEILRMNIMAETNEKLFEKQTKTGKQKNEVLPDHVNNLLNALKNSSNSTASTVSAQQSVSEIPKIMADSMKSLNISKAPTVKEIVLPKVTPPVVVASEKAEIQQWLDDILDD